MHQSWRTETGSIGNWHMPTGEFGHLDLALTALQAEEEKKKLADWQAHLKQPNKPLWFETAQPEAKSRLKYRCCYSESKRQSFWDSQLIRVHCSQWLASVSQADRNGSRAINPPYLLWLSNLSIFKLRNNDFDIRPQTSGEGKPLPWGKTSIVFQLVKCIALIECCSIWMVVALCALICYVAFYLYSALIYLQVQRGLLGSKGSKDAWRPKCMASLSSDIWPRKPCLCCQTPKLIFICETLDLMRVTLLEPCDRPPIPRANFLIHIHCRIDFVLVDS